MTEQNREFKVNIDDHRDLKLLNNTIEFNLIQLKNKILNDMKGEVERCLYESLDSFSISSEEEVLEAIRNGRVKCAILEPFSTMYMLDGEYPLVKITCNLPVMDEENSKLSSNVIVTKYING